MGNITGISTPNPPQSNSASNVRENEQRAQEADRAQQQLEAQQASQQTETVRPVDESAEISRTENEAAQDIADRPAAGSERPSPDETLGSQIDINV